MNVVADTDAPENADRPAKNPTYRDPVVEAFYGSVIQILQDSPDGASAAAQITGAFHRDHQEQVKRQSLMLEDVRRLSADDANKAAMLSYASRVASRLMEENVRQAGRVHAHETVEMRLHDLAGQLDETHSGISEQLRDVLVSLAAPAVPAVGVTILAFVPDPRWNVGWFARSDRPEGALQPLPFAGWALVGSVPDAPEAPVQSAFVLDGTWLTKSELALRGMVLRRID